MGGRLVSASQGAAGRCRSLPIDELDASSCIELMSVWRRALMRAASRRVNTGGAAGATVGEGGGERGVGRRTVSTTATPPRWRLEGVPEEERRWPFGDTTRVYYFGERHENAALLDAQVDLIHTVAKQQKSSSSSSSDGDEKAPLAVVLEFFSSEQQPVLDAFSTGQLPAEDLQMIYDKTGEEGFKMSHYSVLCQAARDTGATLLAGFPPRRAAKALLGRLGDAAPSVGAAVFFV